LEVPWETCSKKRQRRGRGEHLLAAKLQHHAQTAFTMRKGGQKRLLIRPRRHHTLEEKKLSSSTIKTQKKGGKRTNCKDGFDMFQHGIKRLEGRVQGKGEKRENHDPLPGENEKEFDLAFALRGKGT